MNVNEFNKIVNQTFEYCNKILTIKSAEYVLDKSDRLKAFKLEYLNTEINSKEVLWGQMVKHITSVYDMCKQSKDFDKANLKQWEEKITDIINYMVLLKGIVIENASK